MGGTTTTRVCGTIPSVRENEQLSSRVAIGCGGVARWCIETRTCDELMSALETATGLHARVVVIGGGTNVVPNDERVDALVIFNRGGVCEVTENGARCDSGVALNDAVDAMCRAGFSGLEKLAGIPGTVGGAVYGNAGAFGQSIRECVSSVEIWNGTARETISNEQCEFAYRDSVFKRKPWVILRVTFECAKGDSAELQKVAEETISTRQKKFRTDVKAPGSFFKNIEVSKVSADLVAKLDAGKIVAGKIPAGYLLDQIGARGMSVGGARVADFHANWIYNAGGATYADVRKLAEILKEKVRERFGVELEEEVQYIE